MVCLVTQFVYVLLTWNVFRSYHLKLKPSSSRWFCRQVFFSPHSAVNAQLHNKVLQQDKWQVIYLVILKIYVDTKLIIFIPVQW